jgi:hypothetical protein
VNANAQRSRRRLLFLGAGYVAMVIAIVWSLVSARHWTFAELATPQATEEWQQWREEARRRQDRRVPKSEEPPALVLMRDYFAVCLIGAIFFTSLLYWILAWLVIGMFATPSASASVQPALDRTRRGGGRREN